MTSLPGFPLASFVLIVIPGPSVLFVLGRALARGRRTALVMVCGNAAGNYLVALGVAVGIGTLVGRSQQASTVGKAGRRALPDLAGDPGVPATQEAELMSGSSTNWDAYLTSLKTGAGSDAFAAYPVGEVSCWD